MLTRLEALNYRCLQYVDQPLRPFNVLVGPNASGKTTFLDAIAFLGDVLVDGPAQAISKRTDNVYDLFWQRAGTSFELAVEAEIPEHIRHELPDAYPFVRYEIKIGIQDEEPGILGERVYLKYADRPQPKQIDLFPAAVYAPAHIYHTGKMSSVRTAIHKVPHKNDNFYSEVHPARGKGWLPSFKFGMQKSALGNVPDDGRRFPVSMWLRQHLAEEVQELVLNSLVIRRASPPGQPKYFKPDGSNLPWTIEQLIKETPDRFAAWVKHIRTALPDIDTIKTVEREDDKHRYMVVRYAGGTDVPSWMVSDGTLRFLALTLLAYVKDSRGIYLIEEPENGIHPRAIDALFQSLSSVYGAQLLLATHSPVILGLVELEDVLCFAKADGGTDIVSGRRHPALCDWKGEASLGVLFASGILG